VNTDRLLDLIECHLDGSLTESGAQELSAELRDNPAARREFWSRAAIHGILPEAVHLAWLADATPGQSSKVVPLPLAEGHTALVRALRFATLAAAACLLIGVAWWGRQATAEDHSVATLERGSSAIWDGRGQIARESRLLPGRYRLKAGAAELRFRSGARLVVEAPSEIELLGMNEARLFSGQVSGFVPPEARGFRVITPSLTLVDLGTAFGLKVPPSGPAEAHVFEGEVLVRSEIGGERTLLQRDAVRLAPTGYVAIPARPEDFLSDERLAARDSLSAQRHLAQWKDFADRLSRDPKTMVHFTFEDQERFDTVLRNSAAGRGTDSYTAAVLGATWAEGRWPGKSALAFREPGDRVRFEVPGKYDKLTVLASVCLDALPANQYNALLMTENLALGDIRWHFRRNGSLAFGLRTGQASDDRRFEYAETQPIISDAMVGRWMTVATVLDANAGMVTQYVDGEPAGSITLERKTDAILGALEIGNWGIQLDDPRWTWTKAGGAAVSQRNLTGRIDEFARLSRAMSAEEIRGYSRQGQ
jgi:hypothetical protein